MLYMYFCFNHTDLHLGGGTHSTRRTMAMLVAQFEDQIIRIPIWARIELRI